MPLRSLCSSVMMRPGRVLLPTDTGLEEGKNKNTAKLLVVRVLDAAKKQELFEYGRAQGQKKCRTREIRMLLL